jgi:uncharacterized protein YfaT (DUF1175 family)
MASFDERLDPEHTQAIRAYVVELAHRQLAQQQAQQQGPQQAPR